MPGKARLNLWTLWSCATSCVPRNILGVITQYPTELEEPGTGTLLSSSSKGIWATLMPFFHSLFRVGFQSSGWQLSPFLIISTPPKVMCKCGCCLPGVEVTCERDYGTCLGSSAKEKHRPWVPLSSCHPSLVTPNKREFHVFIEQMTRAQAVVLKVTVAFMRAVSSDCKYPSLPPLLFPLPLPSLLWEA